MSAVLISIIAGSGARAVSVPESTLAGAATVKTTELPTATGSVAARYADLHSEMGLADVVDTEAFAQAMTGYGNIENRKKDLLVIIDFTKPSTHERLYIIDVKARKLVLTSHVSHGRNSGGNYATSFSNEPGSYKSSLGFYLTDNTYTGRNGYSLTLNGLEKGINDKARQRAIVIHGAPYCDPANIAANGRLGRSLGCPALPPATSKKIIDTIKDGAVLFIYAGDETYTSISELIN